MIKTITHILPSHWADYLLNTAANDVVRDLTQAECEEIEAFLLAKDLFADDCVSSVGFDWFAWSNDALPFGNFVTEFTFVVTQ